MSVLETIFTLLLTLFVTTKSDLTGSATLLSTSQTISLSLDIDTNSSTVELTMVGPATLWWGMGFGGSTMLGRYAIIADSDDSTVFEQTLANRAKGTTISPSQITICSDTVSSSTRTIVLTRTMDVTTGYNFLDTAGAISMIAAFGVSSTSWSSAIGMASRGPGSIYVSESVNEVITCTESPTDMPTVYPTMTPSVPTLMPTVSTVNPTMGPSMPTAVPTYTPSNMPTHDPTNMPTYMPTKMPTNEPTNEPTKIPTDIPTNEPTNEPTNMPTNEPSNMPNYVDGDSVVARYGYQQWMGIFYGVIIIAVVVNIVY